MSLIRKKGAELSNRSRPLDAGRISTHISVTLWITQINSLLLLLDLAREEDEPCTFAKVIRTHRAKL